MSDQELRGRDRLDLREYLLVLRRRWRMVLAVVTVTTLLVLGYSFAVSPQYVASADVLIDPSGADTQGTSGVRIAAEEVSTQAQVVTSRPVALVVQGTLGLTSAPDLSELVTVQSVGTSRILRVTARDTDPDRAARTANTVASAYLQFRQEDSMARYEAASERLSQEQGELEDRLDEIDAELAQGDNQAGASEDTDNLEAERRTLLIQVAQVMAQLDDLSDALTRATAGGEMLRAADPPTTPVSPRIPLNVALGVLTGLLLGAGAALLRDRFDDVIHDEESARRVLGDASRLGRIPRWAEQQHRGRLITLMDPHAPASEEYQRLGVGVRFMLAPVRESRKSGAVVLTTSSQEGEGKTVTSCNMAVAAARLGLRVVLVDADLRRASAAIRFGLGDTPGLSDLLVGDDALDTYLYDVGVDNLRLLPAGTIPPNPAALLGSGKMQTVLSTLTADADLVIVDSPPVLVGADTLELAHHADMVVVVIRAGVSRLRQLTAAMDSLRHLGVKSVGAVFNGIGDQGRRTYTYRPRERTAPAPESPVVEGRALDGDASSDAGPGPGADHGIEAASDPAPEPAPQPEPESERKTPGDRPSGEPTSTRVGRAR